MTDLSPAAQAVIDAYWLAPVSNRLSVAAALRAAADQVVPQTKYTWEVSSENRFIRRQFLAIATELETTND
jgi:hypothetical protein